MSNIAKLEHLIGETLDLIQFTNARDSKDEARHLSGMLATLVDCLWTLKRAQEVPDAE